MRLRKLPGIIPSSTNDIYIMFRFLSLVAIKIIAKFVLVFMGLIVVPVYLIIWFKKNRHPSPAIKLLSRCIKYGQTLSSEECREVNDYLKKIKNSLECFARGTSPPSQDSTLLAQAIEVLPLIHEIAEPNTCCENTVDGVNYHKGFDCKSSLQELFSELHQTSQLPIISEKLAEMSRMRQNAGAGKRRSRMLLFFFVLMYGAAALLLSKAIIGYPVNWIIGLSIYLSCLFVFFLKYDYYNFKDFKRHQKSLKRF